MKLKVIQVHITKCHKQPLVFHHYVQLDLVHPPQSPLSALLQASAACPALLNLSD